MTTETAVIDGCKSIPLLWTICKIPRFFPLWPPRPPAALLDCRVIEVWVNSLSSSFGVHRSRAQIQCCASYFSLWCLCDSLRFMVVLLRHLWSSEWSQPTSTFNQNRASKVLFLMCSDCSCLINNSSVTWFNISSWLNIHSPPLLGFLCIKNCKLLFFKAKHCLSCEIL